MTGKLGYNIETINGTKLFVAYSPVKLNFVTWVILFMYPFY